MEFNKSCSKFKAAKRTRSSNSDADEFNKKNIQHNEVNILPRKTMKQPSCQNVAEMFPTPDKENVDPNDGVNCHDKENIKPVVEQSPFPVVDFACAYELWQNMRKKDLKYERNSRYMTNHPELHERMRTVLLDWLIEVCEVYTLQRETFYLAVNFLDRYLSNMYDVKKTQLQLSGITALFVAAKLEEIYPPQLTEFTFVTDGACTEEEMIQLELVMLNKLKWSLNPTTPISWLNTYLQTAHQSLIPNLSSTFILPQYPEETFANIAQLLDMCVLDIEYLDFQPSVLAASALYHFSSCELVTLVSGLPYEDLALCIQWLTPFAIALSKEGLHPIKDFNKMVPKNEAQNIQSHVNSIEAFDLAHDSKAKERSDRASPVDVGGFITPPNSSEKHNPVSLLLPTSS